MNIVFKIIVKMLFVVPLAAFGVFCFWAAYTQDGTEVGRAIVWAIGVWDIIKAYDIYHDNSMMED